MEHIDIQFLGSGDAFGSGGRLQSCVLVKHKNGKFLIDCGASCMIGINNYEINPNNIDLILISHLHGDHYGGIPFLVNSAQLIYKRTEPLLILGPPGTRERVNNAFEVMFPGSSSIKRKFTLDFGEYSDRNPVTISGVKVTPYLNIHPQVGFSFAFRIECNEKIIAYSSDTQWTESLVEVAGNADLFIAESYFYDKQVKGHMDYTTLMKHYGSIVAKRLVLTHMSREMLSMLNKVSCEYAEDGKKIRI